MTEERVDVVDAMGVGERVVTRSEMRAGRLRHRCVFVAVVTAGHEVLVHRRADWKDLWPSRWDLAFGGVVTAGEAWDQAARRELAEEAGLDLPASAFEELGEGGYEDDDVAVWGRTYLVRHDGPVTCPDGEVVEVAAVPQDQLPAWVAAHEVCPDSVALVLPRLRGYRRWVDRPPAE